MGQLVTDLRDVQTRHYRSAARFLAAVLVVPLGVAGLAVTALLFRVDGSWWVAVPTALLLALCLLLVRSSRRAHLRGERLRHFQIRQAGLGKAPTADDLLGLVETTTPLPRFDDVSLQTYYASKAPPGLQRLAEVVEESAFYTVRVARASAAAALAGALIETAAMAMLLRWTSMANGAVPFAVLALTGTLVSTAMLVFLMVRYAAVAAAGAAVVDLVGRSRPAGAVDTGAVEIAIGEYEKALGRSLPLPSWIFGILFKRIERQWGEHIKERGSR